MASEIDLFTFRDKQLLRANLGKFQDVKKYFEDPTHLKYRMLCIERKDYMLTETNQIKPIYEIPCFWSMTDSTAHTNMRDIEFSMINGHNLRLNAEYQKARFYRGYWLEMPIQLALRFAHINFKGNSSNLNHYPHSLGLDVDIETDYMLIEATNLTKWLNFEEFQEKINYFHKNDPLHKKQWVLVTTFLSAIPLKIRQQIANNNITLLLTNQVANSRTMQSIANQLYKPLLEIHQQAETNHKNQLITTTKNQYLSSGYNSQSLGEQWYHYFSHEKSSSEIEDSGLNG